MVTSLLHVNHGSILAKGLMSLSKNWIEGLLKDFFLVEERDVVGDQELDSL